ncbi:MAG: enoyl-CoA hydratase-related protein [Acidimicrobiia bacterium]
MGEPDELGRIAVDEVDVDAVLAVRHGAVTVLTLNRPARRNACTFPMLNRYFDLLDDADADESVRAIVVTGADGHFCAGMDADSLSTGIAKGIARRPGKDRRMTHPMNIRKPIIAAINGSTAGFGLVMALTCDIRFAGEESVFTTSFVRRGLNGEYAATWLLPRVVGLTRATELLFSARKFDAAEAERIGMLNWVTPTHETLDRAVAYAIDLAENCSPVSIAATKQQLESDWLRTREESEMFSKVIGFRGTNRQDFGEGVKSFVEKRRPSFGPLRPDQP